MVKPDKKRRSGLGRRGKPDVKSESKSEEESGGRSGKSMDEGSGEGQGDTVKNGTKKRRKVNHACVYCRRSHMTCDLERPCTRCIKRNIGHLCHDEPRDPDSKKGKGQFGFEDQPQDVNSGTSSTNAMGPPATTGFGNPLPPLVQQESPAEDNPFSNGGMNGNVNQFAGFSDAWMTAQNFPEMANYNPNYMIVPEVSHEVNFLNDFLHTSMLDDSNGLVEEPPQQQQQQQQQPPPHSHQHAHQHQHQRLQQRQSRIFDDSNNSSIKPGPMDTLPSFGNGANRSSSSGSLQVGGLLGSSHAPENSSIHSRNALAGEKQRTKEYYYLQAADPTGDDTPEERMGRVLRAKYEVGLLKPFNYINGYARLGQYLEGHIAQSSKSKIARTISKFRPMFREKAQALTDMQLVYVEMWFEKQLMEYDRVFASMAVPACCWRRTGEIFRGNQEMAELINVQVDQLRDGKIALHEILTEESMVRYWEEFGTIAFDSTHDTLLTACSLKNPSDLSNYPIVKCSFSFNIRRDEHKLPALIVGNFLPHDPPKHP